MKLGIDFGTTHTSAAVVAGNQLRFIPLDFKNKQPHLLRSCIYINREQESSVGIEAVRTYLKEDTGRLVRYENRVVGTIKNTVARVTRHALEPDGPIELIYDVVVAEDIGANGRLLQSIKTGLGDSGYAGTKIFGHFYSIEELIAIILRHIRVRAEQILDADLPHVYLGRPVKFGGGQGDSVLAENRLRQAALIAGFKEVTFELEPVAAARFYTEGKTASENIFVFDFGGGTLDMTVMRVDKAAREILATHGVVVGGDDIDSALMRTKVAPHFGTKGTINFDEAPFPAHLAALLEKWQTIPTLSRPQHISLIHRAAEQGTPRAQFVALEALILQNYGFALFEAIEQAKRNLSDELEAIISLDTPAFNLAAEVTRAGMQIAIMAELGKVQKGLRKVMADAGTSASLRTSISPKKIDVIVTTGGSSLIPIFQEILRDFFPLARLVQSDTFGSVTAGLAIQAAEGN